MNLYKKDNLEFEKNSAILFILLTATNGLNFLFQIIMGKLLSMAEYGELNSLFSLIAIVSVPCTVISYIMIRCIVVSQTNLKESLFRGFYRAQWVLIIGYLTVLAGIILFSRQLSSVFQLNGTRDVLCVCFVVICTIIVSPLRGLQQGIQHFTSFGFSNLLQGLLKLVFSVVGVYLGLRLHWIMVGLGLATICAAVYCWKDTAGSWRDLNGQMKLPFNGSEIDKEVLKYIAEIFFVQLTSNILLNGDILLVKKWFSPDIAGAYSAVMTLGKILIYISSSIITILFPIAVRENEKRRSAIKLLMKSLFYTILFSVLGSIALYIVGPLLLRFLYGEIYISAAQLIPAATMYVIPVSLLTILSNYSLAIGKTVSYSFLLSFGFCIIIAYTTFFHANLWELFIGINSVLIIVVIASYILIRKSSKNERTLENCNE